MYSQDGTQHHICDRIDFQDPFWNSNIGIETILSTATNKLPCICCINDFFFYAAIQTPTAAFLLGPVHSQGPAAMATTFTQPLPDHLLSDIASVNFLQFCDCILLLHNLYSEKSITIGDLVLPQLSHSEYDDVVQQLYGGVVFVNQESDSPHNPYDQEVRELNSIREGDIESLKRSWAEDFTGSYGILGPDQLRTYKNLGIIITSLGCRAAIDGGVQPEIAFSLCDSYCQKIEEAATPITAGLLGRKAELEYATMVQEIKGIAGKEYIRNSSIVQQCKDYVFSNLHGRIKVHDIAHNLSVHPNYLSTLFRREVGIPLTQYILQEKVKLAKTMLQYSKYSYIEIANYLGFSSQSHLGKVFVKYTGCTMKEYRDRFRKRKQA